MKAIFEKDWEQVWNLLIAGTRDFLAKNGFKEVVLGLSGGMDSSLVAALAVDALGKDNVHGVLMPSPWSSTGSLTDARLLAKNLGISTVTVPIKPMMDAFDLALAPSFAGFPANVTEENIQSRIRGVILMAHSNKFNWMLLATGNKSELAVGYCTIYGDLCGSLAPIADLYKTEVYGLAAWYNSKEGREVIPQAVFDKAPSAELRPGQKDQDSLPDYEELDTILHAMVEEGIPQDQIAIDGIADSEVKRVVNLVNKAAFKRRQAPTLLPVGEHAFGVHVKL